MNQGEHDDIVIEEDDFMHSVSDDGFWENSAEHSVSSVGDTVNSIGAGSKAEMQSAISLPYADESLPIIVTDPPYYDSIGYADLSDFFYVWMKKNLEPVYPDLFKTELVPKKSEEVSYNKHKVSIETFEDLQTAVFCELSRVLTPDGICSIMYGNKHDKAWAIFMRALNKAGFCVTNVLPLCTEHKSRMNSGEGSLNSSITFVLRKRQEIISHEQAAENFSNALEIALDYGVFHDASAAIGKLDVWQAVVALAIQHYSYTEGGFEEEILTLARDISSSLSPDQFASTPTDILNVLGIKVEETVKQQQLL